jgi:hypothetical protein
MGSLFGGGDKPAPLPPPPPPVPTPTIDDARKRREAADAAAKRRGRQASVFTGSEGAADAPVQSKTLFGS